MYITLFLTIALGVAVGIWVSKDPVRFFKALLAIILVVLEYVIFIAVFVWVVLWVISNINNKYPSTDLETLKYIAIIIIPMVLLFLVGCWIGARKNNISVGNYIENKLGEREREKIGLSINGKEFFKYILKWLGLSITISVSLGLVLWWLGFLR